MDVFQYIQNPPFVYTPGKGDPFVTRLSEWIDPGFHEGNLYDVAIIGVPLSKSSITFSGSHSHPSQFRQLWSSFTTYNFEEDIDLQTLKAVDLGDIKMHVTDILQCHRNIEEGLYEVGNRLQTALPILIGGDHSITYPILKGIKRAHQQQVDKQRIGLIQFDAHLDVRDTTYGGPSNGTPMRNLIESGTILGEDMVTIGLRSFANSKEYRQYAENKGMSLFTSKQVREQGIENILQWAMNHLGQKCDAVYVTFDVDVMDQSVVPGVPAIGPAGLSAVDLFYSAFTLGHWEKIIGMDMVCIDPTKDLRDITSRVGLHLFLHFVSGYYKHKNIG
jgi:formiminoglutamase